MAKPQRDMRRLHRLLDDCHQMLTVDPIPVHFIADDGAEGAQGFCRHRTFAGRTAGQ